MIKRIAAYTGALLIGLIAGPASAIYMAGLWSGAKPLDFGDVNVDGWHSDFAIGSEAANPYTRARVARHGLLALAKSEAVYLTKTMDSEGRPLLEACDYTLSGGAMPAQWWSITLYNSESFLPENDDGALSVDATQLAGETSGTSESKGDAWEAVISAQKPQGDTPWLSSRNAGTFDLTLRLYVPSEELLSEPEATLLPPLIKRLACRGDAA